MLASLIPTPGKKGQDGDPAPLSADYVALGRVDKGEKGVPFRGAAWTWLCWQDAVALAGEVAGCGRGLHGEGGLQGQEPGTAPPKAESEVRYLGLSSEWD